ncbi:16501_t:CDS:2, partial [Dentiscutata heterogama]
MESNLLTQLSNDYIKLFKTGEYYDVVLCAGQEPNRKEFRVHSLVLRARSAYFRSALSSNWVRTQENIMLFFKPNVSPEVFEVILNFLYGGTVCLAEYDAKVILDVLKATDELCIPDLSEYIQNYLLTHPWRLMSHFIFVHRFATEQGERYPKIRKCVIELIKENPTTIFDSSDFTTMDQNTLLSFFKCQHFFMKPVEIWKRIIEWGIANTPGLPNPKTKWETENYDALGESLKSFIPLIKFDEMNYDEFLREVQPWRNSLDYVDHELYEKVDSSIQLVSFNNRLKTININSVLITTYDAE